MLWDGAGIARLPRHLARLSASAAALGFAYDPGAVAAALAHIGGSARLRLRLTLGQHGDIDLTSAPLPPPFHEWRVALSPEHLASGDPFLRHKTTQRHLYDSTRATLPDCIDEVIFQNERSEVCEGTITSIFFDLGNGLLTPPLASGCLPGVLRAELLDTGRCHEAVLTAADLPNAKLFLGNSLRGLALARLSTGR
jgi:4-amino-4-deoxychorismate lyase